MFHPFGTITKHRSGLANGGGIKTSHIHVYWLTQWITDAGLGQPSIKGDVIAGEWEDYIGAASPDCWHVPMTCI